MSLCNLPLLLWCCYYFIYTFMYPFLRSTCFGLLGVHLQEQDNLIVTCDVCDCVWWSGSGALLVYSCGCILQSCKIHPQEYTNKAPEPDHHTQSHTSHVTIKLSCS